MEVEKMRLDKLAEKIPMLFSLVKSRQEMHLQQCNNRLVFAIREILTKQTYRLGQLNDMFTPLKVRRNQEIFAFAETSGAAIVGEIEFPAFL